MNRLSYGDNLDILRKDVPDDGGELVYLAPPFKHNKDRSILERKRAEEALFVEKERAEVTLNSIGDAVLSTDISGNVTYLNVVAESMSGSTRVEASGRPLAEVFNIVDGTTRQSPKAR